MSQSIDTTVAFAASHKDTYAQPYDGSVTVETVLAAAVSYYEVASDGTTRYYLFYEGRELAASATLGELVSDPGNSQGHGQGTKTKLKLKLRTETISG